MSEIIDLLFLRTWWSWHTDAGLPWSAAYHWFNVVEGCVWLLFAASVLWRYRKNRRSSLEWWYALSFFTFGLTDFREAWVQQSWLIWVKAFNLIALLWLRNIVIRRYYPQARIY